MSADEERIVQEMGEDSGVPEGIDPETGEVLAERTPENEPEAAPPPVPSQAEIERRMKTLEKEADRHNKKVAEIMGDDFAMLVPSPLDWTPGFLWNPAAVPLPDEVKSEVLALLGAAAPDEFLEDPERESCETCAGLGMLKTGSRVPNQDALPCRACNGQGWRQKLQAVPPQPFPATQAPGAAQLPPPNQPVHAADQWGRPFGHPHYGMQPASVGA